MVEVLSPLPNGKYTRYCGGTLISNEWVLTAAHCLNNTDINTLFIVSDQVNLQQANKQNVIKVDKIWIHPDYDEIGGNQVDISLLHLTEPVTFTSQLSPICLPTADMRNFDNLFNIGWGQTSVNDPTSNQLLYVDTEQRDDCETLYKKLNFWSKQVCSYVRGNGICQGDSGGPLSTRKNGYVTQVGINSWVIAGTCGEYPDVTTRVSDYLDEIYEITAGSGFCRNRI